MSKLDSRLKRLVAVGAFALATALSYPVLDVSGVGAVRAAPVESTAAADTQSIAARIPERNPYEDPSQCTYFAWEMAAQAGHRLPDFGDAGEWRAGAIACGYRVIERLSPSAVNSVAVWMPGVGGASPIGHVGWVTAVDGDRFFVKDRNWVPDGENGRWIQWEPGISFITFDGGAGDLQIVEPLSISATSLLPGEHVRVRFTLKNIGSAPVTVQDLVVGGRLGDKVADFPHVGNVTVQPGGEYTYEQEGAFSQSGDYSAEPVMCIAGGWAPINGANRIRFTVRDSLPLLVSAPRALADRLGIEARSLVQTSPRSAVSDRGSRPDASRLNGLAFRPEASPPSAVLLRRAA